MDGDLQMVIELLRELTGGVNRLEEAAGSLDSRVGSVETRMTALEAGLGSMRIELRERFEPIDGRLRVLSDGFQFLDGRTAAQIAPVVPQLLALQQQVRSAQEQLGRMESAWVQLGFRLETLGDHLRQRFRDLNARPAHLD